MYKGIWIVKSDGFHIWTSHINASNLSCAKKKHGKNVKFNFDIWSFLIIKFKILAFFDYIIWIGEKKAVIHGWIVAKFTMSNFLHFKNREKSHFEL